MHSGESLGKHWNEILFSIVLCCALLCSASALFLLCPALPLLTQPYLTPLLFFTLPYSFLLYATLPSHTLPLHTLPYSKSHCLSLSTLLTSFLYFCSFVVQLKHSSNIPLKSRKILLEVIIPHL